MHELCNDKWIGMSSHEHCSTKKEKWHAQLRSSNKRYAELFTRNRLIIIMLKLMLKLCFTFVPLHLTIGSDKQGTARATLPEEHNLLSQIVAWKSFEDCASSDAVKGFKNNCASMELCEVKSVLGCTFNGVPII